jgi:hypothetical protein
VTDLKTSAEPVTASTLGAADLLRISQDLGGGTFGNAKLSGLSLKQQYSAIFALQTTTINGHALSANVTVTASDVGALPTGTTTAGVPDSTNRRYVTDAGLAVLGDTSGTNTGDQDLSGLVPNTRTVNGKALSADIALTAADVGIGLAGRQFLNLSSNNLDPFIGDFDMSGDTVIKMIHASSNTFASVNLAGCTALTYADFSNAQDTIVTSADFSGCSSLGTLYINHLENGGVTTVSISDCSALVNFSFEGAGLTSITLPASAPIAFFSLNNNALPQSEVDAILAYLDAGGLSEGIVDLSAGTNAVPSAAGLASQASLEGKNWQVNVNS